MSGRAQAREFVSADELFQQANFYATLARTQPVEDLAAAALDPDAEDAELPIPSPCRREQTCNSSTSRPPPVTRRSRAEVANAYAEAFSTFIDDRQEAARAKDLDRIIERVDAIQAADPQPRGSTTLNIEIDQLQTQAATIRGASADAATILQEATPPDRTRTPPKPLRDALLAFLAALVIGAAAAYARSALTDRYASAEEGSQRSRAAGPRLGLAVECRHRRGGRGVPCTSHQRLVRPPRARRPRAHGHECHTGLRQDPHLDQHGPGLRRRGSSRDPRRLRLPPAGRATSASASPSSPA